MEKIKELLLNKNISKLKILLEDMIEQDIATALEELPKEQMILVFRLLSKDKAAETFTYMEKHLQESLIHSMTDKELRETMNELFTDDAVDLIEEMPANIVKRILANISSEDRKVVNEFLNYPEDSAGSIMTNEFVDLKENMTVEEAFNKIRKVGVDKETIYTCYVLDKSRKLLGLVSAKELLLASPDAVISDLMETNIITANTYDDQETVARTLQKYDFLALPVVDKENRLVGIVTVDDAIDV